MTDTPDPFTEILPDQMASGRHSILIRPYAYGQLRIQLTRTDRPDGYAPPGHGSIVRELCTYEPRTAVRVVTLMRVAADPEAYCRTLETPHNCEAPGRGRIRLDNRAPFKCPDCGAESWNENDKRHRYCVRCHKFFDEGEPS